MSELIQDLTIQPTEPKLYNIGNVYNITAKTARRKYILDAKQT